MKKAEKREGGGRGGGLLMRSKYEQTILQSKSWNFTIGYKANEASHALIIHTLSLCRTHTSLFETQHFRVSHGLFGSTLVSLSNFCIKSLELCMINDNWCHFLWHWITNHCLIDGLNPAHLKLFCVELRLLETECASSLTRRLWAQIPGLPGSTNA